MTSVSSVDTPRTHRVHVVLSSHWNNEEVIVPMWMNAITDGGNLHIPPALQTAAQWVYDLDDRKIIKNTTGKSFVIPLGVEEVSRDWLVKHKFVRVRRPQP